MYKEELLSVGYVTPWEYPDAYKQFQQEKSEKELAYSLFKKIDDGNFYSVKINKLREDRDIEINRIDAHVHQIRVMNMIYTPQPYLKPYLNWKERLKVLFTGHYPVGIGWE